MMGAMDATCGAKSSSIEGCANSIFEDYQGIKFIIEGLRRSPDDAEGRLATMRHDQTELIPKIALLGSASDYQNVGELGGCDAGHATIERCEIKLQSARNGNELLSKPEVVTRLSSGTRKRLNGIFTQQEALYKTQLNVIAASWTGDPSDLCRKVYASVGACERAVTMDADALRREVFPIYSCGRLVRGKFRTRADLAEEARHANDPPMEKAVREMGISSFSATVRFYRDRLREEKILLAQAKQAR